VVRASVGRKGVRGGRKALSRKLLAVGREGTGLRIVLILVRIGVHKEVLSGALSGVFCQQRGEEAAIRGDGFEKGIRARLAVAAEHQVAEMRQLAGFGGREEAIGDGDGELGEDAVDFVRGNGCVLRGGEFAGEIGRAKPAVRGVGMWVAEAVAFGMRGEGAAASIGEGKAASGRGAAQRGSRGGGEEPFGGLRVDILRRVSKALASHGERLAKVNSIYK
jgi:hypothetical protein